jgi:L-proline amide hydrolase
MTQPAVHEGTVAFRDGVTWYRVTGELPGERVPLVVVHGGPGATHDYISSLARLASSERAVIHYDQLGCGRSTHFPDRGTDFYMVALYLDELANLLEHLGIADRYHLLGQSWGGMLGAEHAVRRPHGLRSLVISNSPASMALWVAEATRLREGLPEDVHSALDQHEAAGTLEDPAYLAATQSFYDLHVCRVVPNPPEVTASFEALLADPTVYRCMNGPNEFFCIGSLRSWSIVDRVHSIEVPTLLISGEFDEATPATVQPFFDEIPDVRWAVMADASHMPFVEHPDRYDELVTDFLLAND